MVKSIDTVTVIYMLICWAVIMFGSGLWLGIDLMLICWAVIMFGSGLWLGIDLMESACAKRGCRAARRPGTAAPPEEP